VPSLSVLSPTEFWTSAGAKICYICVQLASTACSAAVVAKCTELRALPVLRYILQQHFEVGAQRRVDTV
jgi:hypothetical protein